MMENVWEVVAIEVPGHRFGVIREFLKEDQAIHRAESLADQGMEVTMRRVEGDGHYMRFLLDELQ